jgi:hypothetical protein
MLEFSSERPSASRSSSKEENYPLSTVANSAYSQLPSIPGGRLLKPQHEDALCPCVKELIDVDYISYWDSAVMRILGSNKEEVRRGWKKLHNEQRS